MPPKRRAEAISRDPSDSEGTSDDPQPRRQRRSSSESSAQSDASATSRHDASNRQTQEQTLIKKLVRLALATEYSRTPLRRSDISTKIFKDSNGPARSFKAVFDGAQKTLRDTFGMELVELPSKEKTSLKDRRLQATQTKASSSTSKSWMLTTTLPRQYKTNPAIIQPTNAPDVETESSYTALCTFIVSLIYLNNNTLTEYSLNHYLTKVNANLNTPFGMLDKLLQRMQREGYIDKRRQTVGGEDSIEWFVGPRGKVEIGVAGVTGLVKSVYGHGAVPLSNRPVVGANGREVATHVKIEEIELNAKLERSLHVKIPGSAPTTATQTQQEEEVAEEARDSGANGESSSSRTQQQQQRKQKQSQTAQPPRRSGRRIAQDQDDDGEDDGDSDEAEEEMDEDEDDD